MGAQTLNFTESRCMFLWSASLSVSSRLVPSEQRCFSTSKAASFEPHLKRNFQRQHRAPQTPFSKGSSLPASRHPSSLVQRRWFCRSKMERRMEVGSRATAAALITECSALPKGVFQPVIWFQFVVCDLSWLLKSHILIFFFFFSWNWCLELVWVGSSAILIAVLIKCCRLLTPTVDFSFKNSSVSSFKMWKFGFLVGSHLVKLLNCWASVSPSEKWRF